MTTPTTNADVLQLADIIGGTLGAMLCSQAQEIARLKKILRDVAAAQAYLASPEQSEPVSWAISYDGKTPYKLWDYSDGALLDAEIAHAGGTASKMPLYAAPQPVGRLVDAMDLLTKEIERVQTRFSEIDATVCKARDALQWFVDNDDTNIGQEGNEFWEDGLNEGIAALAAIEAVRK